MLAPHAVVARLLGQDGARRELPPGGSNDITARIVSRKSLKTRASSS